MTASLPEVHFLTDGDYDDYRPAVGPMGEVVIFERPPSAGAEPVLYQITDFQTPNPQRFLSNPAPSSQTRPDWCWQTGTIAFNGASAGSASVSVWWVLALQPQGGATAIPDTEGLFYPTWRHNGAGFVAENHSDAASPRPCNSTIYGGGHLHQKNIDGTDPAGNHLYGGMPAAKPGEWPLIAFAGQPKKKDWVKTGTEAYNEGFNYIFLNATDNNGQFTSRPMEPGAPLKHFDKGYQGRAPAWSPDARTIAFESNREGGYAIYLCDVDSGAITRVTDPAFGAQHAKFFPCGTKLILCGRRQGGWAIAWVDISTLLQR